MSIIYFLLCAIFLLWCCVCIGVCAHVLDDDKSYIISVCGIYIANILLLSYGMIKININCSIIVKYIFCLVVMVYEYAQIVSIINNLPDSDDNDDSNDSNYKYMTELILYSFCFTVMQMCNISLSTEETKNKMINASYMCCLYSIGILVIYTHY